MLVVRGDAAPGGDGTGWATALRHVQEALDRAANSGGAFTEIWVANGAYRPDFDPAIQASTGSRSASFRLVGPIILRGGFAGYETDPAQRDPAATATVLSGDLSGNDAHDTSGQDNSFHVVDAGAARGNALLEGFIITGGQADPESGGRGAGLFNDGGTLTVRHCRFVENAAWGDAAESGGGGAVFNRNGRLVFNNCVFERNEALHGGAIHNDGGTLDLKACTLELNLVDGDGAGIYSDGGAVNCTGSVFRYHPPSLRLFGAGGGIYATGADLWLSHCTFEENESMYSGAGAYVSDGTLMADDCVFRDSLSYEDDGAGLAAYDSDVTVTDCRFEGNHADDGVGLYLSGCVAAVSGCWFVENIGDGGPGNSQGGGMCLEGGTSAVWNCVFRDNQSWWRGGGGLWSSTSGWIANCTFIGNRAYSGDGGGIYVGGGSLGVINCTLHDNAADYAGGNLLVEGTAEVVNTILWGGGDETGQDEISQVHVREGGAVSVNHSLVQGLTGVLGGTGNLGADPLWADVDGRVGPGSPCVDAGNNAVLPAGLGTDLDGRPRRMDVACAIDTGSGGVPVVDIGAYEAVDDGAACGAGEVTITAWRSVRLHGGGVSGGIDVPAGGGVRGCEPRIGGVQMIQVDFSGPIELPALRPFARMRGAAEGILCDGMQLANAGQSLLLHFEPGRLADGCYQIDLAGSVAGLTGDSDVELHQLAGDVNGDGQVNLVDYQQTRGRIGASITAEDARFDVNVDGWVSLIDVQLIKSRMGQAVQCP